MEKKTYTLVKSDLIDFITGNDSEITNTETIESECARYVAELGAELGDGYEVVLSDTEILPYVGSLPFSYASDETQQEIQDAESVVVARFW